MLHWSFQLCSWPPSVVSSYAICACLSASPGPTARPGPQSNAPCTCPGWEFLLWPPACLSFSPDSHVQTVFWCLCLLGSSWNSGSWFFHFPCRTFQTGHLQLHADKHEGLNDKLSHGESTSWSPRSTGGNHCRTGQTLTQLIIPLPSMLLLLQLQLSLLHECFCSFYVIWLF